MSSRSLAHLPTYVSPACTSLEISSTLGFLGKRFRDALYLCMKSSPKVNFYTLDVEIYSQTIMKTLADSHLGSYLSGMSRIAGYIS